MSMSTDIEQYEDEQRQSRAYDLSLNTDAMEAACKAAGATAKRFTDYHYRISKPGHAPVDFYPVSGKFSVVGSNRFEPKPVKEFIDAHFADKAEGTTNVTHRELYSTLHFGTQPFGECLFGEYTAKVESETLTRPNPYGGAPTQMRRPVFTAWKPGVTVRVEDWSDEENQGELKVIADVNGLKYEQVVNQHPSVVAKDPIQVPDPVMDVLMRLKRIRQAD